MGGSADKNASIFYAEVGRRIRKCREDRKMSQAHLAERTGFKRTSISNVEKGRQQILVHTLCVFAQALEVPVADLMPSGGVRDISASHIDPNTVLVTQSLRKAGLLPKTPTENQEHSNNGSSSEKSNSKRGTGVTR